MDERVVIDLAAVRRLLPGIPEREVARGTLASGWFCVEHQPPLAGRAVEAVAAIERELSIEPFEGWYRFWRVEPARAGLGGTGLLDYGLDHWFQVRRWRAEGSTLVVERADREATMRFRRFRDAAEEAALRRSPYLIPCEAVRGVLDGVPEHELEDPEVLAGGVLVVEHDPPLAGRAIEVVGEIDRAWNGVRITSERWHRFWRQVHDPTVNDGRSTGTDNDIDHWFEVGAWRVEADALIIDRADRPGTMRFRRVRDEAEARALGVLGTFLAIRRRG